MGTNEGPLGILAGRGRLPLEVADEVCRAGRRVHLVGIRGNAEPAIVRHPHTWVDLGQVGAMLRALRTAGCRELVILGGVRRPDLRALRPDTGFYLNLPLILRLMSGGDDSVLRKVVSFFERRGFAVIGAHEVAPALLAPAGSLGDVTPAPSDLDDIERGFALIEALGAADVGQAVVIAGGKAIAIEAAEGTDDMLRRLAGLRAPSGSARGGVLVKGPKPGQELRVDLPVIGPATVEAAIAAGLRGIAVAAGHVLLADRAAVRRVSDKAGLFVFGTDAWTGAPHSGGRPILRQRRLVSLAGHARRHDVQDAQRALHVLHASARYAAGTAVVAARRHVLAVEAGEGPQRTIERVQTLRQWGDERRRKRRGLVAFEASADGAAPLVDAATAAGLAGVVLPSSIETEASAAVAAAAERAGLFVLAEVKAVSRSESDPTRVFLIAGEHSGDALGASLMKAVRARRDGNVTFAGVGGKAMQEAGLRSLFPMSDVAVMGPLSIAPRLPRIIRRIYRTVEAALAAEPDVVVIIDSPEFTHPIAKRIRQRRPDVPIIDYVSPSVWAWRPGRAPRMRAYIDHVLALLPFEPEAHRRLGGPPCTYVGHPAIERLDWLASLDPAPLAKRLGIAADRQVLVVLPGSRASEVGRLMEPFGATIRLLMERGLCSEIVIPALPNVRAMIEDALVRWPVRPHLIEGEEDKFRAFKLARAALAASGTVTLELGLAGTPMVVAYRIDAVAARLRFLVRVPSIVLANLVLGEAAFPEFVQEDCSPEKLAAALQPLMSDTPERLRQLQALSRIPGRMRLAAGTPSEAAADIVLAYAQPAAFGP